MRVFLGTLGALGSLRTLETLPWGLWGLWGVWGLWGKPAFWRSLRAQLPKTGLGDVRALGLRGSECRVWPFRSLLLISLTLVRDHEVLSRALPQRPPHTPRRLCKLAPGLDSWVLRVVQAQTYLGRPFEGWGDCFYRALGASGLGRRVLQAVACRICPSRPWTTRLAAAAAQNARCPTDPQVRSSHKEPSGWKGGCTCPIFSEQGLHNPKQAVVSRDMGTRTPYNFHPLPSTPLELGWAAKRLKAQHPQTL